jgi:hypothetical protein
VFVWLNLIFSTKASNQSSGVANCANHLVSVHNGLPNVVSFMFQGLLFLKPAHAIPLPTNELIFDGTFGNE